MKKLALYIFLAGQVAFPSHSLGPSKHIGFFTPVSFKLLFAGLQNFIPAWVMPKELSKSKMCLGAVLMGLSVAHTVYFVYLWKSQSKPRNTPQTRRPESAPPRDIVFPRKYMSPMKNKPEMRVEGYWATSQDPKKDVYAGYYPFPQANDQPWNGKEAFITKLCAIERSAADAQGGANSRIQCIGYRGLSLSRLNGEIVGNREFYDTKTRIAWPEGLRKHYFKKFNVIPSQEFYEYVMNFERK